MPDRAIPTAPRARPGPPQAAPVPSQPAADDFDVPWSDALDLFPISTFGLIVFFILFYGLESKLAPDMTRDGGLGQTSLVALGAASYDRVIGHGEWWRVFLAPLLHASISHQAGNCLALFFVGVRLELMVGRVWLLGLFAVSALGGLAGSLLGNPHAVVTVGASGAITGLIGALFVVSFHHKAGSDRDQSVMRRTALFFGVPALLPLAFGASGNVDYFAHAGGFVTGALASLVLCLAWPSGQRKPGFTRAMGLLALAFFSLAAVSGVLAGLHFKDAKVEFVDLIPEKEMPAPDAISETLTADLIARYPCDPRGHFMRGLVFAKAKRLAAAEYELRSGLELPRTDTFGDLRGRLTVLLALVVDGQGRHLDARSMITPYCAPGALPNALRMLAADVGRLCRPPNK